MAATPTTACEEDLAKRSKERLEEYFELIRIPSVSALPEHQPDIERAAAWVADRLRAIGVPEVEILPTDGKPLVWGRWHVSDDQPTALIYAHYDVQPPDPLDLWQSPPFEPTVRGDRVYARGASDDKAGVIITLQAVEALVRANGKPPINLIFFYEGEEEIGSPAVPKLVAGQRDRFACDFVLSADGSMAGPDLPSLTVGLKGLCGCQIDVRSSSTDLHSGMYGATVPNAVQALVRIAAGLHTPDGRVAVKGFYDKVRELTPQERQEIADFPFDEAEFKDQAGVEEFWGEPDYSPLERVWTRPTLDFNGIWGGFQGAGNKTVTPAEAHVKITCRLVPNQDPAEIVDLIRQHVQTHCPAGVDATVTPLPGRAMRFAVDRGHPALVAAAKVLREIYGKDPVIERSGGTVPVAEVFQRELGADVIFFAFGLPGSQVHAPNEWFRLEDLTRGARAYCALLTELAKPSA
jgi:acetylornithine deacetylase/succinyl-diaminopimelate desuccinylase-like protein